MMTNHMKKAVLIQFETGIDNIMVGYPFDKHLHNLIMCLQQKRLKKLDQTMSKSLRMDEALNLLMKRLTLEMQLVDQAQILPHWNLLEPMPLLVMKEFTQNRTLLPK